MKKFQLMILAVIPLFILFQGCGGGAITAFDRDAFQKDPGKFSAKYMTLQNGKLLEKTIVKKVVVTEFNVEYIVNMEDEAYSRIAGEMYDTFVKNLKTKAGLEVVSKDVLRQSRIYQMLDKTEKGMRGGGESRKVSVESWIVPAPGLANLSPMKKKGKGFFGALKAIGKTMGNTLKEAALIEELGVDAVIKVHLIAYETRRKKDARATLVGGVPGMASTSQVVINVGVDKNPTVLGGLEDEQGNKWVYTYKGTAIYGIKHDKKDNGLIAAENAYKTKGTVASGPYGKGIVEMTDVFSTMVANDLKWRQSKRR
ncbi:MAG: hypothetical protein GXO92_00445 [FCB group bacterium]|nr:hypothetical protein [FCB group bacterium]